MDTRDRHEVIAHMPEAASAKGGRFEVEICALDCCRHKQTAFIVAREGAVTTASTLPRFVSPIPAAKKSISPDATKTFLTDAHKARNQP